MVVSTIMSTQCPVAYTKSRSPVATVACSELVEKLLNTCLVAHLESSKCFKIRNSKHSKCFKVKTGGTSLNYKAEHMKKIQCALTSFPWTRYGEDQERCKTCSNVRFALFLFNIVKFQQ